MTERERLHKIEDDLGIVLGFPEWEWLHIGKGVLDIEAHLRNHAELQRQYPEETSEADD